MFRCPRPSPAKELECPHAMGTHAIAAQRARVISSLSAVTIAPFDSFAGWARPKRRQPAPLDKSFLLRKDVESFTGKRTVRRHHGNRAARRAAWHDRSQLCIRYGGKAGVDAVEGHAACMF